ncbi:MAG: TPM domain-containing protein [Rhodocyclaceae bacterium]
MNGLTRFYRHVWGGEREARNLFPPTTLERIEQAVARSEGRHRGELRILIEGGAGMAGAWRRIDVRQRALAFFSELRVWDTDDNSGVLIYLLLAEHRIEIIADRGIDARVPDAVWDDIARTATAHFRQGNGEEGVLAVIDACTTLLAEHFPAHEHNVNELPDAPIVI